MDHLSSGLQGPGQHKDRVFIGHADKVDIGAVEQAIVGLIIDIIAGHGLQQHTLGQPHALFIDKLVYRGNFTAGDTCHIADNTFNFGYFLFF